MPHESTGSTWPDLQDVPGPAGLIEGSPWCITPNTALAELIGVSPLVPAELEPMLDRNSLGLLARFERGTPLRSRLEIGAPSSDGQRRWLHGDFVPGPSAGRWLGCFVDLTPMRPQEEGIERQPDASQARTRLRNRTGDEAHEGGMREREAESSLAVLFDTATEGIVLIDGEVIADANPLACELVGHAHPDLVGRKLSALLEHMGLPPDWMDTHEDPQEDLRLCLLPHPRTGDQALFLRSFHFTREDQPCRVLVLRSMRSQVRAHKRIEHLITDLRRQTTRAEAADRSKSVFLASASHDLRQPIHSLGLFLTTIRALSQRSAAIPSHELAPIATRMRSALDGLTQLLDLLLGKTLHSADGQKPVLQSLPLQPMFDDLVSEFAPQAQHKGLKLKALSARATVHTDPLVLRRILANFLANAVRYTERGRVVMGARRRGDQVEIQVWDTGVGISSDQLDLIFHEFQRLEQGAPPMAHAEGLGLSIARRASAQLNAHLDVRSVRGQGSMFSVQVPRSDELQFVPASPAVSSPPEPKTNLNVLLIDDDPQVLSATASLMESWGHRVLAVRAVDEALRLWNALSDPFDVVIGDYQLDSTQSGLVLRQRVQQEHGETVPVCLITGDLSAARARKVRAEGFALLHKPVSAAALKGFLAQVRKD